MNTSIEKRGRGLSWMVGASLLGASLSAQAGIRPGGQQGNLADDIHERSIPETSFGEVSRINELPRMAGGAVNLEGDIVVLGGPVLDGGMVFVDLDVETGLEVSVEATPIPAGAIRGRPGGGQHQGRGLRLAGGTPGNAGAILVGVSDPGSPRLSRFQRWTGTFGRDGSFLVELPQSQEDQEFAVQGVEFSLAGTHLSAIKRVQAPGQVGPNPHWTNDTLDQAARRATSGEEPVRMRFLGTVSLGSLRRAADVTVVLSREKNSFAMYLGSALAQATGLADPSASGDQRLVFRSASALAAGIQSVMVLDAYQGIEFEFEATQALLGAQRCGLARCGTPSSQRSNGLRRAAIPSAIATAVVDLQDSAVQAEVSDATRIDQKPHRVTPPEEQLPPPSGSFGGIIHDAGSITVDLGSGSQQHGHLQAALDTLGAATRTVRLQRNKLRMGSL